MKGVVVAAASPTSPDELALLASHLDFARATSPPEDVHALDVEGLSAEGVSFFSARSEGQLVGIGALKKLEAGHAEIKSMHVARTARGRGVGRILLGHLLQVASEKGCLRVSLETGPSAEFAAARALYAAAGFRLCEPFGDYVSSPHSTFMTLVLGHDGGGAGGQPT